MAAVGKQVHGPLDPTNCARLPIDHPPQVQSIDRQALVDNVLGLAKAARGFKVPTIDGHSADGAGRRRAPLGPSA